MDNYDTVNSFLSSLELKNSNTSKTSNTSTTSNTSNTSKNKKTPLDRMEDSQEKFNKDKEFTNNFMCFRDMNFKKHLETQPQDFKPSFNIPFESEEQLTQRKQKTYLNDKLSERNNIFNNRQIAPILDNQPIFSRSNPENNEND